MINKKAIKSAYDWAKLDKAFSEVLFSFLEGTGAWLEYMEVPIDTLHKERKHLDQLSKGELLQLINGWLDGLADFKDFYTENAQAINNIKKEKQTLEKEYKTPQGSPLH